MCVKACSQEEACGTGLKDQQVLGVQGYAQLFQRSVETLRSQLTEKGEGAELVWDKVSFHKIGLNCPKVCDWECQWVQWKKKKIIIIALYTLI